MADTSPLTRPKIEATGRIPWTPVLASLGAFHIALGGLMVFAPGFFFDQIGGWAPRNDHYIRDAATFLLALGAVLTIAARRPSWRAPTLAYAAIQYALHSINHLADVNDADPGYLGPANLVLFLVVEGVLLWLLREALRDHHGDGLGRQA